MLSSIQPVVNIGMVGHVDHGKTSLTHGLTGKWTDTHSEEIRRGISIRLGYADAVIYECTACMGSERFSTGATCLNCGKKGTEVRRFSIVDAPGHETLMTTMLSGAAVMNGAILVIAANEPCPQPSTTEHMMALKIAGIQHIIVCQNKVDLVSKELALENHGQIVLFLKEHGYENLPVIPTAAHFKTNLDLLIEAIQKYIPTPIHHEKDALRLVVLRSFDINKPGTLPEKLHGGVVGGSIVSGILKNGDEIEISPGIENGLIKTKVVGIQTTFGSLEKAVPGGLLAIETTLDPNLTKNDQMKGQIVASIGTLPEPALKLSLKLFPFKRLVTDAVFDLKPSETVVLTVGTMTAVGTIIKISKDTASLVLKNPVVVEQDQKIVISKRHKTGWRLAGYGILA
ncbi:MAG: translation initiation factor IF-2 subunit gamma [Candidatus Micrarchaeota archaeon]